MNQQDIAYNVLSFLNNPKGYRQVSQSFLQGSQIAQKEYMEYIRREYPLITMTLNEVYDRLLPIQESNHLINLYNRKDRIKYMMQDLILFYLNKMALNQDWDLFRVALTLIDKEILRSIFESIIDILHMNDNDELAFELWKLGKQLNVRASRAQEIYYTFYSAEPDEQNISKFWMEDRQIGYIPEEVIEYWDRHSERWRGRLSNIVNLLPAIMGRKFQPKEKIDKLSEYTRYSSSQWKRIMSIARDYPYENTTELLTHFPPDLLGIQSIIGVTDNDNYHQPSLPFNHRILQYIHDFIIKNRQKASSYYSSSPIVISSLQDIWLNDLEQLREMNEKADRSKQERNIQYIPNYIAVKQAQRIPIDTDDLLDSFADITPIGTEEEEGLIEF